MRTTKDFLATLPRGAEGHLGVVPGAKMPPPEISLVESNKKAIAAFWKAREHDPFLPKATVENGVEVFRSMPQAAPIPLPDPEESAAALQAARADLAKAITKRDGHIDAAGRAQIALEAAQRAVRRISDEIAVQGDVDGLAARWRASRIAAGKPDALPPDLMERREKRDALLVEKRDAEGATRILEVEMQQAQARLAEAEDAVAESAAAAFDAHASALAHSMAEHQRRAFALKQKLLAMADTAVGGRRYRLPNAVAQAVRNESEPWTRVPPTARAELRSRWSAIASVLMQDADALLADG